jgi:hypothetical protein
MFITNPRVRVSTQRKLKMIYTLSLPDSSKSTQINKAGCDRVVHRFAKACSISAIMSSASSTPTEILTRSSVIPVMLFQNGGK